VGAGEESSDRVGVINAGRTGGDAHLARVLDVRGLGLLRLEACSREHVRGLRSQALVLGGVDDRDRHRRGGHGLRVRCRAGNVAGLGVLDLHGEVVPEGNRHDPGEHEGGDHRDH